MKRNVVLAVTARLAASVLTILLLVIGSAQAADRALLDMLGYSADGEYFAFEEFGIQDGSGFAFSTVYVVDLAHDKWTYGTPFSVVAEDEDKPLAAVRAEAVAKAQSKLDEYKIGVPVQILALIGDGAAGNTGLRIGWSTPACCGPGQTQADEFSLILETRGIGSDEDYCKEMNPVGFNLYYQDRNGRAELHKDGEVLPKSRRCTLDYRIYAVVQPFEEVSGRRVAVIASFPFGFEGVDRRFLVVPIDK